MRALVHRELRLVGLENKGNTCFLNGALQLVLSSNVLLSALLHHKEGCSETADGCVACAIVQDYEATVVHAEARSIVPAATLRHLLKLMPGMPPKSQQDSEALLLSVLNELAASVPSLDLQRGQELWTTTCQVCGERRTEPPTPTWSIQVQMRRSVEEGLDMYFSPERMSDENKVWCSERCQRRTPVLRSGWLKTVPDVLIVQLARFKYNRTGQMERVHGKTDIGPHLDLTAHRGTVLEDVVAHSQNQSLRCVGVVLHHGQTPNSGHYTAIVLDKNQHYLFDDSDKVKKLSLKEFQAALPDVYYALYERERSYSGPEEDLPAPFLKPQRTYSRPAIERPVQPQASGCAAASVRGVPSTASTPLRGPAGPVASRSTGRNTSGSFVPGLTSTPSSRAGTTFEELERLQRMRGRTYGAKAPVPACSSAPREGVWRDADGRTDSTSDTSSPPRSPRFRRPDWSLSRDLPVGQSSLSLSRDAPVGQSSLSLTRDLSVGQSPLSLPSDLPVGHSPLSLSSDASIGQSFHDILLSLKAIASSTIIPRSEPIRTSPDAILPPHIVAEVHLRRLMRPPPPAPLTPPPSLPLTPSPEPLVPVAPVFPTAPKSWPGSPSYRPHPDPVSDSSEEAPPRLPDPACRFEPPPSPGLALRCTRCGQQQRSRGALARHVRQHEFAGFPDWRPWRCAACPEEFRSLHALHRHSGQHVEPRGLACRRPGCREVYPNARLLLRHEKAGHRDARVLPQRRPSRRVENTRHQCRTCWKRFGDCRALFRHRRGYGDKRKKSNCRACARGVVKMQRSNDEARTKLWNLMKENLLRNGADLGRL